MPTLSQRAAHMPASPIRKLVPYADAARARGLHVHQLNIGQPDVETPRAMIEAYRRFDAKVLAYGPSAGLPELREAIARYYARLDIAVLPEQVHVTNGGSEALQFAIATSCDPGDELLCFEPFYANYNGFAQILGVQVRPIPSRIEDRFHLPADAVIEAEIGPRTRGIVFSSPSNPTGVVYRRDEIERLGALARKHDLVLIADEVYREFTYDGAQSFSALRLQGCDAHVIVIDSVSKRFSACGARVGCTVTRNADFNSAILRMCFARLCPATVDQHAAIAGYELPASYFEPVVAEYTARRDALIAGLGAIPGVRTYLPEGAFYTIADLPVDDADTFCLWMLQEFSYRGETVMMAPGSGFYASPGAGRTEVRIAYVLEVPALQRALAALAAGLAEYPGRRG